MDINELESFKLSDAVTFHKELNPKLWQDDKLDPEVRDQLMLIAEDFVEYLGIGNLKVKDVTISGSNAAYSYTPHSDLDLHVLVDFNDLPNNEVYQELFTAKKTLYNDSHDISVLGVPVELYVQDTNQDHISLGEYSIVYDKWIRIPKKRRANFDEAATKLKYEKLGDLIELALQSRDPKRVKATIDLVKRYRKAGLDKAGEFGPENLAFKAIRKQGLIQDLYDLRAELHGEKLSIEEENQLLDKPTLSVAEIADKHGVNRMQIANELDKGIKVELEHTNDKSTAREIALDHLAEDPTYYSKLSSLGLEEDIGFKSWKNPTPRALYNLTKRSKFGNMRGLYHEGDTYWWDADNAIHSDGAKELGIPYDYQSRMLAAIDSVSGNYRVGGDDHVPSNITRKYDIENDLIYESSLMETTEESQLINLISKRAAKKIFKMFRKEPSELVNFFAPDPKRAKAKLWGISANELGVPYINNPVLANVLNHVKFVVSNKPDSSEKNTLASYNQDDHDIVLHYPVIKKFSTIDGYSTEQYIAKSIAHELQHAVDNFKSAGKTFVTKKSAYNTQPYEINARFQEALMNITNALDNAQKEGKTVNPAGLPKFIAQIFEHNDISQFLPKDGRRYKQLVKRAYKFFEAELNNPKKEQPLSIVKRALNYIFDKPTGTVNEASGAKIDAHRVGDTVWINYFEVPVKGKGLGRAEYEKFEKSLPKDIKKIRLVASNAGYGPTHDFWDRMGFDYAYPDDDNEMVKLLEAPRTFAPQVTPLEKLIQDYGYFTSFGTVHLDKQATTPEGQQQLLSLVQRLQKDSKSFNGIDKQKIEANRDTILNHIYQMMQYAIPILKKHLPADKWEAKREPINRLLTAYNNARPINESNERHPYPYGYWIDITGELVPVETYNGHEAVGRAIMQKYDRRTKKGKIGDSLNLFYSGAIRVVTYNYPDMEIEICEPNAKAARSLIRLLRDIRPDTVYYENNCKINGPKNSGTWQEASRWVMQQATDPNYYDNLRQAALDKQINEASGYIPSEKEKNDPRFKTALTVDVKPNSIKDNAAKLGLGNIKRTGVPQTANPNGKPRTK